MKLSVTSPPSLARVFMFLLVVKSGSGSRRGAGYREKSSIFRSYGSI